MSSILKYFKKHKLNHSDETEISSDDIDSQSRMSGATSADKTLNVEIAIPTVSAVPAISLRIFEPSFFDNKISPNQPRLDVYPATPFGRKVRRFNPEWYSKYKWLEYSIEKNAAFHFACRIFPSKHTESTLNCTGFLDWKNATGIGVMGFQNMICQKATGKQWKIGRIIRREASNPWHNLLQW